MTEPIEGLNRGSRRGDSMRLGNHSDGFRGLLVSCLWAELLCPSALGLTADGLPSNQVERICGRFSRVRLVLHSRRIVADRRLPHHELRRGRRTSRRIRPWARGDAFRRLSGGDGAGPGRISRGAGAHPVCGLHPGNTSAENSITALATSSSGRILPVGHMGVAGVLLFERLPGSGKVLAGRSCELPARPSKHGHYGHHGRLPVWKAMGGKQRGDFGACRRRVLTAPRPYHRLAKRLREHTIPGKETEGCGLDSGGDSRRQPMASRRTGRACSEIWGPPEPLSSAMPRTGRMCAVFRGGSRWCALGWHGSDGLIRPRRGSGQPLQRITRTRGVHRPAHRLTRSRPSKGRQYMGLHRRGAAR